MSDSKKPLAPEPVQLVTSKGDTFAMHASRSSHPAYAVAAARVVKRFDDDTLLSPDEFEAAVRAALSLTVA